MNRHIVHFRIDHFPVAVERLRDPSLCRRPVVVCARHSPRSLIFSASPEARMEGVFERMPLTQALRRCRRLVILPPDEARYQQAADRICRILGAYSPLVEPGHWGRFFVDMTGMTRLFGGVQDTASRMRLGIKEDICLSGTVGIGANKLVSGVAARVVASCGDLYSVPGGSEASFLAPLRIRMLPAVRYRTEQELLAEFNIHRIQQLAGLSPGQLAAVFGRFGMVLHRQSLGIDETPVRPPPAKPFVLAEQTLTDDTNDDGVLLGVLYDLTEKAARRMRGQGVSPGTVWLHIRYSDGMDITRRGRVSLPVCLDPLLFQILKPLFFKANRRRQRVRYMGLTFTDLAVRTDQLALFEMPGPWQTQKALITALDTIRGKYGEGAVRFGRRPVSP